MREFALLRGCRNSFGALGFLDWFILRCSGVRWLGLPVVRCTNRSCATVPGGGTSCAHQHTPQAPCVDTGRTQSARREDKARAHEAAADDGHDTPADDVPAKWGRRTSSSSCSLPNSALRSFASCHLAQRKRTLKLGTSPTHG